MNGLTQLLLSLSGSVAIILTLLWTVRQQRRKNKFSPFTEKILRSPGYTLGKEHDDLVDDLLVPFMLVGLIPIFYMLCVQFVLKDWPQILVVGCIFVVGLIASLRKIMSLYDHAQRLNLGLDGEVYTGQELNFLMRQGAWVFHDIPYQYGNIDHIVISTGGVFVVETKAVRKPANEKGARQSRVKVVGDKLHFPHIVSGHAVKQARIHAKHVAKSLKRKTGKDYPVTPVVALPGWFIEKSPGQDFLVINPKRGGGLKSFVEASVIPPNETEIIANHIEDLARSVSSSTDRNDPDANKKYDFWLNRKPEEPKL